jgi:hypothetical protein
MSWFLHAYPQAPGATERRRLAGQRVRRPAVPVLAVAQSSDSVARTHGRHA